MKIHALARATVALMAGSLLVVSLSGCDIVAQRAADEAERAVGEAERAVEDATGVRIDAPAPAEGEEAQLPEGWPPEVPVYPEATITDPWSVTAEGVTHLSAVFRTKDAHQDVSAWFKNELEAKGWTIDSEMTTGSGQDISTTYTASMGKLECGIEIHTFDGETKIYQNVLIY